MRIAILAAGDGWHVRDLLRAAAQLGHEAVPVDFRRLHAGVRAVADPLAEQDAVLVRTMPPGSLEQVVVRMDLLHRLQARGITVLNPPRAVEACVDKYLATAWLDAAGLPLASRLSNYFHYFGVRGAFLMQLNRNDEARTTFDRAIALANTSAEAAHIRMHLDRLMRDSQPRGAKVGK